MLLPKGVSPKAETARQALLLACQLFGVNAGEVERATCVWRRLLSCQTPKPNPAHFSKAFRSRHAQMNCLRGTDATRQRLKSGRASSLSSNPTRKRVSVEWH